MSSPPQAAERAPSPFDVFSDRRAMVDSALAPVAFVVVNQIAGLQTAAAVAVGIAVVLLLERLVRRTPVTYAIGGLFGTGLAVFIALRSGSAEGYFVPRAIQNAVFALVFLGSVLIGRPLIGLIAQGIRGFPGTYLREPTVRRAFREVTLAWAGLFALRAAVYTVFIAAGREELLGASVLVLGWPAFALLAFGTFKYVPWRLRRLGAPDADAFTAAHEAAEAASDRAGDAPAIGRADAPRPADA